MPKLTKRIVDAAEAQAAEYFVWDNEIPGFGLRVLPSGRKGYVVQYRAGRRSRRISLGPSTVLTCEQARTRAITIVAAARNGQDPAAERDAGRKAITIKELAERFDKEHIAIRVKASTGKEYRRKPNKTVESKHAGETLGGGGLRGADGTVRRKTGYGNAIQSHRIPDSVFRIMRHKGGLGAAGSHPAVFPVALVEAVLEAFTDPGDLVFEPFCGSGSQLIAAERTGRCCRAVELDPVYCDVAVRRWELATGNKASRVTEAEAATTPVRRSRRRA